MSSPHEVYYDGKIYDKENMALVTASCSSGHMHYNLSVAEALAFNGSKLNKRCGVLNCQEFVSVLSVQANILSSPAGNPA